MLTDRLQGKGIAVAIYSHPEFYPPLLNAIHELACLFNSVSIISRNLKTNHWKYPPNTVHYTSGPAVSIRDSEQAQVWWKMISFLRFTRDFYRLLKYQKQEWVMCNDPISLFSFRLLRVFLGHKINLWYHSHDVTELNSVRKYSVGYFSLKSERTYFHRVDLFTLPSEARLEFYPVKSLKGKWLVVPNYPSLRNHEQSLAVRETGAELKLLYQGRVSNEHGLEEIIDFMKTDGSLHLTVIGPGDENYVQGLRERVISLELADRISFLKPVSYSELKKITGTHQLGLAINKPINILYRTGATASNKIYEYVAAGLPILYYKDVHYEQFLGKYSWAFSTVLTVSDLTSIIRNIRLNYQRLSQEARIDFKNELNFEAAFRPVISFISARPVPKS